MKLVFISNMLNHHQMALCKAFQRKVDSFTFIAISDTEAIGYQTSQESDFVLHYYNEKERKKCLDYILNADVVIYGSCPNELIQIRMNENKLSFLYTERFLKKGVWRRFIPRTRKKMMKRVGKYKDKNLFVLCASAYASFDLSLIGYPINKCYKWGYFPQTKIYDDVNELIEHKIPSSILWAGRFLNWKHPEVPILVAKQLKADGYSFKLNIVGSGEMERELQQMIKKYCLEDCVFLVGSLNSEEVRFYMEKHEIFLFTSDRYEGWGAVLNEAMNSACGVVANHTIGSVPYLINNEINGLIYADGDMKELIEKTKLLLDNSQIRHSYGKEAYKTIVEQWNSEIASDRFLSLCQRMKEKMENYKEYSDGPCSFAGRFSDKKIEI